MIFRTAEGTKADNDSIALVCLLSGRPRRSGSQFGDGSEWKQKSMLLDLLSLFVGAKHLQKDLSSFIDSSHFPADKGVLRVRCRFRLWGHSFHAEQISLQHIFVPECMDYY